MKSINLTKRELEVLKNLSEGLCAKQSAYISGLSHQTVKNQLRKVYIKLGALSGPNAVAIAFRKGILR